MNNPENTAEKSESMWRRVGQRFWTFAGTVDLKPAIKTSVSICLGWALGLGISILFNPSDRTGHGLWTALSALVVQQAHLGTAFKSGWHRILGVTVGCFLGALVSTTLGANPLTLGFAIFFAVVFCTLVNIRESISITCLFVAVVIILGYSKPDIEPWGYAFWRLVDSAAGIMVGLGVAYLLWPLHARQKIETNFSQALEHLADLYPLSAKTVPLTTEELAVWNAEDQETEKSMARSKMSLEDARLDLLQTYLNQEDWEYLSIHLDTAYEAILVLQKVNKTNIAKIMDQELAEELSNVIHLNHIAIKYMATNLGTHKICRPRVPLEDAFVRLNDEAARHRKTWATRHFELEDVEAFFVYFYKLRSVGEELSKMQQMQYQLFEEVEEQQR
jgi:uncharacterized membrane protein YgaE (UPF0421/DUF939 family)